MDKLKKLLTSSDVSRSIFILGYGENDELNEEISNISTDEWKQIIPIMPNELFTFLINKLNYNNLGKIVITVLQGFYDNQYDLDYGMKFILLEEILKNTNSDLYNQINEYKLVMRTRINEYLDKVDNKEEQMDFEYYKKIVQMVSLLGYFGIFERINGYKDNYSIEEDCCTQEFNKIELEDWINTEFLYILLDKLNGRFSESEIMSMTSKILLLNSTEYKNEAMQCEEYKSNLLWISMSNGFYSRSTGKVCVRVDRDKIERIKATVLHELLHSICPNFKDVEKTNGLNEAMTEYLTLLLLNREIDDFDGYEVITSLFKEVILKCGISLDQLLDCYFSKDLIMLKELIDSKLYVGYFDNVLLPALNTNILGDNNEQLKEAIRILQEMIPEYPKNKTTF